MRCAIRYHLYNFKNVKNTHGGVFILVKSNLLKLTLLHGCFSRFLIVQMVPNAPHIAEYLKKQKQLENEI